MDPIKADPDYESINSALELNEEEDKKEKLKKIKEIIEEEYNTELKKRQEQIEHIEHEICKVRKLLHLLRYVLITSYYNKKELSFNGEEEASTSDLFDKQNRLHPAVKKLLAGNVQQLDNLNAPLSRKKRKLSILKETTPEVKKQKIEPLLQVPIKAQPELVMKQVISTNRKKVRHRIIVGNISKYIPSLEDANLTHKWMVYVRGPKDLPDVSHFVEKVVFYLHPSYKPYDVVEVCTSPFHLSRRGWGEFPVRVQIFFRISMNKPVDIVHNIKLDKTCTGRQTLGNETVVDLFLYESEKESKNNKDIKENVKTEVEENEKEISFEHDYCDLKEDTEKVHVDHNYNLPQSYENQQIIKKEIKTVNEDSVNSLIYGLEEYLQSYNKSNNFAATKTAIGKKIEENLQLDSLKYKIVVPKKKFKNMGEFLPYLFKRMPIFTKLATDKCYKRLNPYCVENLHEFVKWNVGKRRNAEWNRAKLIRKMSINEMIFGVEKWNTKAILMYGRSHLYTPYISYGLFNRESVERSLLLSCFANGNKFRFNLRNFNEDITVNVDSDIDENSPKKLNSGQFLSISDPNLEQPCSYIRQASLDCGVILKPEVIGESILWNGAERMILEAVKCFADNLIRRANNYKICQHVTGNVINKEDVEFAINERPEMRAIAEFRNRRRNLEFFS